MIVLAPLLVVVTVTATVVGRRFVSARRRRREAEIARQLQEQIAQEASLGTPQGCLWV